jgi:hypothetical protein
MRFRLGDQRFVMALGARGKGKDACHVNLASVML